MVKQELVERKTSYSQSERNLIKRNSSLYEYLKLYLILMVIFSGSTVTGAEKCDKAKQIEENTKRTCEIALFVL